MTCTGPPQVCTRPLPETTNSVCPSGWVCQWVRAPGSKRTSPERSRAGSGASMIGSCQTVPVNDCAGPRRDGTEPLGRISMVVSSTSTRRLPGPVPKVKRGRARGKINEIMLAIPCRSPAEHDSDRLRVRRQGMCGARSVIGTGDAKSRVAYYSCRSAADAPRPGCALLISWLWLCARRLQQMRRAGFHPLGFAAAAACGPSIAASAAETFKPHAQA